jgi:hypothetical protein
MVLHLLLPGIHAHFRSYLQASIEKSWTLAHEEFLLSLECFSVAALLYWLAVVVGSIEKQQDMPKQDLYDLSTMEAYSFAPGRPRQETKEQKRERLRKQTKEKRRKALLFQKNVSSPLSKTNWCILPHHLLQGYEFWIHILRGESFLTKRQSLLEEIDRMNKPIVPVEGFDRSIGEKFRNEYLVKAQHVLSFLHQNQKLRWIFKRFFTKARIQRFAPLNEKDPITLDSITQPIQFPSFRLRKQYIFEAKPFVRHLHNKLLHNDGQIPTPLYPKNPFTNELFSLPQMMSLIEQARQYGHSSWAIESFVASRYDIVSFSILHSKPLRLHAFRDTMAHVTDWDAIDILYDFIKSQHEVHDEPFMSVRYKWALVHAPHADRIVAWRKLCLKWYETDILLEDASMKLSFFREVETKTLPLCDIPNDLRDLKLNKNKPNLSVDGSRSS